MNNAAQIIPDGENIKLVIRHSIRYSLKEQFEPDNVPLTREGMHLALHFGKGLHYPIGEVYSSNILRCLQTAEFIMEGYDSKSKYDIKPIDMKSFYCKDKFLCDKAFDEEDNGKSIVAKLNNGDCIPGLLSLEESVEALLDFLFSTGNHDNQLDLYCTHDFQMMLLISGLFDRSTEQNKIKENWPMMLEGLLFWGCRNDFTCIWRGEAKHYVNAKWL